MKKIYSKKQRQRIEKGYTLIEVILVIAITGITFTTLYSLYASTVKRDVDSRYEIIASNLAQEGIEIVRNVRDQNAMISGKEINDGLTSTCHPYFKEGTSNPECDGNRLAEVELKDGIYRNCLSSGCDASENVVFERVCTIGGDIERMVVTCTVSWDSFVNSDINREASATATFTDWQEN